MTRRRGTLLALVAAVLVVTAWIGESRLHALRLESERRQLTRRFERVESPLVARTDDERAGVLHALAQEARRWSEDELARRLELAAEREVPADDLAADVLRRCLADHSGEQGRVPRPAVMRREILRPLVAQVPDCAAALAGPLLDAARDPNADVEVCGDLLIAFAVVPPELRTATIEARRLSSRDREGLRDALRRCGEAFPDVHPVGLLREEPLRVGERYDDDVPMPDVRVAFSRPERRPPDRGSYGGPMPDHADRPARFGIDVVDASSGAELTPHGTALVRDGEPEALATSSGRTFHADAEPRPGDRVLVYVRGFDPVVATWNGEETLRVELATRSAGEFRVRLDAGRHADLGFAVTVRHGMGAPGLQKAAVYAWQQVFSGPGETARITCPQPAQNWLRPEVPGDLPVTPPHVWARPGDEIVIRHLPLRDVRLVQLARDGGDVPEAAYATFAVDARRPVDAAVADNVRRWSPFGQLRLVRDDEGWVIADVPEIGLHVFFTHDGVPRYVHVPEDRLPELPSRSVKPVAGRPDVAGAPVPEMTILAPGRLDLETARAASCRPFRVLGYSLAVHDALDWDAARLPDAAWLTAYHPSFGIAYLPWAADVVPEGEPEPGEIVIRAEDGGPLAGAVRVKPAWRTTQEVWTGGSSNPLHVDLDGRTEVALRGLPLGLYSVQIDVLTGPQDAESSTSRERLQVELTEQRPQHVHLAR